MLLQVLCETRQNSFYLQLFAQEIFILELLIFFIYKFLHFSHQFLSPQILCNPHNLIFFCKVIFLGGHPPLYVTSFVCLLVHPSICSSVCPSVCCAPYLRKHTLCDHSFWYTCVKWWYLQFFVFFSFFFKLFFGLL